MAQEDEQNDNIINYRSSNGSCNNCFTCIRSYLKYNELQCLINERAKVSQDCVCDEFVNEVFYNIYNLKEQSHR
jgi:hypothetical protein